MRLKELYSELIALKKEIDERLKGLNASNQEEFLSWLQESKIYQKLKSRDNQLIYLNVFHRIRLEERKKPAAVEGQNDIYCGIHSLKEIEEKYLTIKFGVLRLETEMEACYYEQALDAIIEYGVTGIALYHIIVLETAQKEQNIIKMAKLLKRKGKYITALILLKEGLEAYGSNGEMLLELAECWMKGEQWKQAYDCLKRIEEPGEAVRELTERLEKVISI